MERKTLAELYSKYLFQIPDYQRGYAWENKQWVDLVEDLDALLDDRIRHHYTGTVVIYHDSQKKYQDYGIDKLEMADIVDGQQRLATITLYLSIIIRKLIESGGIEYQQKIHDYLYSGTTCRLSLHNDVEEIFLDLQKLGHPIVEPDSVHSKRLFRAYGFLNDHIRLEMIRRPGREIDYLRGLYEAITKKLVFTFYVIEEECEIGMTFELMNSRGKGLSILELLKNYLMYWISYNVSSQERKDMTAAVNKAWKNVYANIGACDGREDQCLRIAWTLNCSYVPKNWAGYDGFKQDAYIPLRNFTKKTREETQAFILNFTEELAKISSHYANIISPKIENYLSDHDLVGWLKRIHRTGYLSNFLPLLVSARMHLQDGSITAASFSELLQAIECFAYRVFLLESRRGNSGLTNFYSWADELKKCPDRIQEIVSGIYALIGYYAPADSFHRRLTEPDNWYSRRVLLKYTLYEYEKHLLKTEGKGQAPKITWEELGDSTIEHILPQNPQPGSHWLAVWEDSKIIRYLHDIGNLVLTQNNSNYLNHEFSMKKGQPGISPSYANSDIRQERKLAHFEDWQAVDLERRRSEIVRWAMERWMISQQTVSITIEGEEDETDLPGKISHFQAEG